MADQDDDEHIITQDAELGVSALTTTRAARISQVSSMMGFQPRREHHAFVAEYTKAYAIPGGNKAARATAQFDKGIGGMDHAKLKGFVITVTAYVQAEPDLVRQMAPEVMRDDLLHYLKELGDLGDISTPVSLVMIRCEGCSAETPEFFVLRSQRLCRDCFGRKVGSAPPLKDVDL